MYELSLNIIDMLLIFLFIWLGISMFIANPVQGAYFRWLTRGITIFMLFLVGKEMIRTSDDLWTVTTIFAAQGLIMGVMGIIEGFFQINIWLLLSPFLTPTWKPIYMEYHLEMLLGKIVRIKGPFFHPVHYGQYLAFLLPFCIGIMSRKRMLGIIAFPLALLAMIFTQTRSAYIAAIVSLVVFIFFAKLKIAVKTLVVVILGSTIIAFFFSPYLIDLYEHRILETVHSDGIYHSEMLARIKTPGIILNAVVRESPSFGFGPHLKDNDFVNIFSEGEIVMNETPYAVMGAFEHGVPYFLGVEIYFGGIMMFMVYLVMHYRKGKDMDKYGLSLIFLTAFAASMVTLHIQQLGETLSNIIIVFAGIQSVYYHEKYILKSMSNR
ncbi:MAG: O-antigen ligase family protein [Candidatus Scalinduaceae bacterium]